MKHKKKFYQSYLKKKVNAKLSNQSKLITQQPKTFENSNIVDTKLVIIEHPETSRKLSKTIRKAEKVFEVGSGESSNSPLYSETKN